MSNNNTNNNRGRIRKEKIIVTQVNTLFNALLGRGIKTTTRDVRRFVMFARIVSIKAYLTWLIHHDDVEDSPIKIDRKDGSLRTSLDLFYKDEIFSDIIKNHSGFNRFKFNPNTMKLVSDGHTEIEFLGTVWIPSSHIEGKRGKGTRPYLHLGVIILPGIKE